MTVQPVIGEGEMSEHLDAKIHSILVTENERTSESYTVGANSVTRIEAFTKSGMHADIAYVRVYKNDQPHSEFCQHNIIGVYYLIPQQVRGDQS